MRWLKHGWISGLGWAALASWILTFTVFANVDVRHATQDQQVVTGFIGLAALVLTSPWIKWRLRIFRWKMRSEAWYDGRQEARERWQQTHTRERRRSTKNTPG
ncbi:MAG TPA: hypothetical protein VMI06_14660 [Terriglobia bacterium]|nr:hypothetical protein [Terriglobia bacterium]